MYDIIGDIHGHADELQSLLERLGYSRRRGYYEHPERKIIFLGDFIDRGPKIRETLGIVRPMVESGAALAVLGNHEFNAIAYHTRHPNDPCRFLREHNAKNLKQHSQTLAQLTATELYEHLEWFKTLPLFLELPGQLRAVHASWDDEAVALISARANGSLDFFVSACSKDESLFAAVEAVLKGREIELPKGQKFVDKDGQERKEVRVRWWEEGKGQSYQSYCFPHSLDVPTTLIPHEAVKGIRPYPADSLPVFFGHYWLKAETPRVITTKVCCLDYSVAKGGYLCSYRWDGERELCDERFVSLKE